MGSISDYSECPNCKQDAYDEYYYKTGEGYIACSSCGYYKSVTIKNREKLLTEITNEDLDIVEISNPFGAYRLRFKGEFGTLCGTLESPESLEELKSEISEKLADVECFEISRLEGGKIIVEDLLKVS